MIPIHKTPRQYLFIFHQPGARSAWVYDGQSFLRFVYLPATQEFRFVRRQENLPAGLCGEAFQLSPLEVRSLRREAAVHHLTLHLCASHDACILNALPVNRQQTVYDLIPPAGSVTSAGIATRRSAPPWSQQGDEE
jgi:hypothetical protein